MLERGQVQRSVGLEEGGDHHTGGARKQIRVRGLGRDASANLHGAGKLCESSKNGCLAGGPLHYDGASETVVRVVECGEGHDGLGGAQGGAATATANGAARGRGKDACRRARGSYSGAMAESLVTLRTC